MELSLDKFHKYFSLLSTTDSTHTYRSTSIKIFKYYLIHPSLLSYSITYHQRATSLLSKFLKSFKDLTLDEHNIISEFQLLLSKHSV